MKIWSLPKHENLTTGKKYRGKEEKLLLRSNFSSFPQYFQYISFKSPITHIFVKCGCLNNFFLSSANLICRGMDISKYFRESLGIRDNESRMYFSYMSHNLPHTFCRFSPYFVWTTKCNYFFLIFRMILQVKILLPCQHHYCIRCLKLKQSTRYIQQSEPNERMLFFSI